MDAIHILGCRVDAVDRSGALECIVALANGRPGSLVVTLGVEMVMAARRDESFRRIVNGAALNVCDTIGLLLASRLRRGPLQSRVTGIQLVTDLAARSAQHADIRLFFLGGSGATAMDAAQMIRSEYPGAVISGARDGYFHLDQSDDVARAIAASGANVLCIGMGSPKQEEWFARYGKATACGVGIGVGGSFDVLAGTVRRAPALLRRMGLEWAYRLYREPRRWRRQLALPRFAVAVAGEICKRKEEQPSRL